MLFRTVRIVKAGIFLMITLTLKEIETPTGVMRLGATEDALVLCDWPDAPGAPHCLKVLCKRLGAVPVTGDSPILEKASKALEDYFAGRLQTFDLPLRPCGTPFQESVWRALLEVPYGKTASYGDIARRIGRSTAFRAVAQAVGSNPLCIAVPCHRIIGSDGSLTGFGGGLDRKVLLLKLEGHNRF